MKHAELIGLLIETSVAMSVATLLVLLLRRPLLRWFGAGLTYASWWLVPLTTVAVLLPAASRPVLPGNWIVVPGGAVMTAAPIPYSPNADPWLALSLIWLIGAIAMTLLTAWRQRRFQRRLGTLRRREDGTHQATAQEGLPAAFGLIRPKIVVPSDFEQRYDAEQQALIRAHEATHIARGDLRFNALAMTLRCVYWFNPLLHYAAARFRHDQELSCDARVVARHPQARRAYAQAMFTTQLAAQASPLGCHWGHTHPLQERIQMLKRNNNTPLRRIVGIALVMALVGGVGTVAWAAQPQQAVAAVAAPGTVVMELLAKTSEREQRFTKIEPLGKKFSISTGSKGALWLIEGVVTVGEDKALYPASTPDTVWLTMRLHKNGKLVATPKVAVKSGGIARVKQSIKSDSAPDLDLQIKLTATKAVDVSVRSVASR
ncbi:MAG: M56 family metallopeptidase [Lysobacter sp.]